MKPIFIALLPNVEKKDFFLVLKLLFSPFSWRKGKEMGRLETVFKQYFQTKFAVSFLSGRTALWAILKSLGIKKGDEVLLQAYTCVVVPNTIISLGGKPVWVDINPETFNMDVADLRKKISKKTRAVIIQHTFGQAAEIEKIMKIAQKHHLWVIEDCAQALGGECQGRKLGTLGDVAFFSFGRDKIISSVFGGMAITNNIRIGKKLREIQKKLSLPSYWWIFRQLLHPLIFFVIIKTYYCFGLGKFLHLIVQKTGLVSKAVFKQEKKGEMPIALLKKMPQALALLALSQFARLEKFNRKRIKIAQFYTQELKGLKIKLPKIKKNCLSVFLRYTIKTKKAEELIAFAKKKRVFLGDWYRPVIAPQGVDFKKVFYQKNICPQAERAAAMSVNLPTFPRMTIDDAKRVVNLIKEFYGDKRDY